MKKALSLILIISAEARAERTYQERVDSIHNSQSSVDQILRQWGRSVGFDSKSNAGSQARSEQPQPIYQLHASLASTGLPPGKLLFGRLINRLVVGADGSPTLVELDPGQSFASGLRFMGIARQAGTQGRVSIELNRLLLRGGRSVPVQATSLDMDGAYGLSAQVFSGKAWAVAGAMASGLISGLASGQQTQTTSALGFSQIQSTGRNALLQGVAQSAADQSKRLLEEATAEKPVLVVEALTPVTVLIQEEAKW